MSEPALENAELLALVAAREERLTQAAAMLSAEPHVLGVFLGGSLAAGSGDAFSDIDLRVVVESEHHSDFVRRRLDIPRSWPGFVFNEWMPGAQHCVSHFEPFGKVDIFYLDAARMSASPWYGLPNRVLHDPKGFLKSLFAQSKALKFDVAPDDVGQSISKGLAALHEALRRAKRGELIYAQTLLDELRHHIMKADDWLFGRTPTTAIYAKFDTRGSKEVLDALRASYGQLEAETIIQAAAGLREVYQRQVSQLHERFDLHRPLSNDNKAFKMAEAAQSLPAPK